MAAETGPIINPLFARMNHQFNAALEKCQTDIQALQSAYDQLKVEFETLKGEALGGDNTAEIGVNPRIGDFNSYDVRSPNKPPPPKYTKVIRFTHPYPTPPSLPVGFKMLDLGGEKGICINSLTSNVNNDSFGITLETWNGTQLHGAICTWLELSNDPDFQFGRFDTENDHPGDQPQQLTARRIVFERPYSAPPQVVVWLCAFGIDNTKDSRVRTYATDITMTGFIIHIDTWGDSILWSGSATWIAYPANKPKVFSGSFSTSELRRWNAPQHHNSGFAKFGDGVFTTPPRVAMAINSFEVSKKFNARLSLSSPHVGVEGMTWVLSSWWDTILYSAGGSFIALG